MNIGKAAAIGTLALGTLAGSAKAQTVTIEASTPGHHLPKDALLANQFRIIGSYDKWKFGVSANEDDRFGTKDVFSLSYNTKIGSVDFAPGMRQVRGGLTEGSLYFGKSTSKGRLNAVLVADDEKFRMLRAWGTDLGGIVDIGGAIKSGKGFRDAENDVQLGVHTRDKDLGIWVAKAADNTYGMAATRDAVDFGAYMFGQYSVDTKKGFAVMQATFDGDGKRFGGQNNASSGQPTVRVTGKAQVDPGIGPQPSFLQAGGRRSIELGYVRNATGEYAQAQYGQLVRTWDNGTKLYAGGGFRIEDGKLIPVGEAVYSGKGFDVTLRATPEPVVSVTKSYSF